MKFIYKISVYNYVLIYYLMGAIQSYLEKIFEY